MVSLSRYTRSGGRTIRHYLAKVKSNRRRCCQTPCDQGGQGQAEAPQATDARYNIRGGPVGSSEALLRWSHRCSMCSLSSFTCGQKQQYCRWFQGEEYGLANYNRDYSLTSICVEYCAVLTLTVAMAAVRHDLRSELYIFRQDHQRFRNVCEKPSMVIACKVYALAAGLQDTRDCKVLGHQKKFLSPAS
jgi:hypothetical protein